MYTPLVASALTLGASLFGTADTRAQRHVVRDTIYAGAAVAGFGGLAFHSYNILNRPRGCRGRTGSRKADMIQIC